MWFVEVGGSFDRLNEEIGEGIEVEWMKNHLPPRLRPKGIGKDSLSTHYDDGS